MGGITVVKAILIQVKTFPMEDYLAVTIYAGYDHETGLNINPKDII